jgi:hypothetical protein
VDGEVQTDEVDSKELIIRAASMAEQDELADQQVCIQHFVYIEWISFIFLITL